MRYDTHGLRDTAKQLRSEAAKLDKLADTLEDTLIVHEQSSWYGDPHVYLARVDNPGDKLADEVPLTLTQALARAQAHQEELGLKLSLDDQRMLHDVWSAGWREEMGR